MVILDTAVTLATQDTLVIADQARQGIQVLLVTLGLAVLVHQVILAIPDIREQAHPVFQGGLVIVDGLGIQAHPDIQATQDIRGTVGRLDIQAIAGSPVILVLLVSVVTVAIRVIPE